MDSIPQRYDASEDIMVPVTQEWVDTVVKRLYELKAQTVEQTEPKSEAPLAEGQVAVAYAVTVDGFIAIKHKAIRNPQSPLIVWMTEAQWTRLANCATAQGQFYIARTDAIQTTGDLRALVASST